MLATADTEAGIYLNLEREKERGELGEGGREVEADRQVEVCVGVGV